VLADARTARSLLLLVEVKNLRIGVTKAFGKTGVRRGTGVSAGTAVAAGHRAWRSSWGHVGVSRAAFVVVLVFPVPGPSATNSGQYILDGKIMGRRENNGFMHEVRFRPVYGLDLTSPFGQGPKQVQTARLSRCFRIVSGATNKKTRPKARLGF
jgi:hypothetical protein